MNKPNRWTLWITELVMLCLWCWLLTWMCGDVPKPWRLPVVLALFYVSQIASHLGRLTKAAIAVLKEI